MSATPARPGQDEGRIGNSGPQETAEEAPELSQAQGDERPRGALKVAKLPVGVAWKESPPFCA